MGWIDNRRFIGLLWLAVALFGGGTSILAQTAPDTYWVEFTDKSLTPYSLSAPEAFLSARAIQRRAAQDIPFDELDLPVDPAYVAAVDAIADVQVLNRSKWFNGITVRVSSVETIAVIQSLPFVADVRARGVRTNSMSTDMKFGTSPFGTDRDLDPARYGPSYLQLNMLHGDVLHGAGALGQGMLIGVLDSGFEGVDVSTAFDAVRQRSGFIATHDLVDHDGDVYADHWHGRCVLSCMAGSLDSMLIGTAPEADYVLIRTEDVNSEYPVEEDYWISGVELADSLGCDVLNTSLGYTTFDDSTMDHTYAMLDGQTLRSSIAANIAAQKGMIPVISAGNSGGSDWFYISTPADAIDVLAVGAVGDVQNHAPFSSHGPSADGRVKPDVCAMGWGTRVLDVGQDSVVAANGTSFAAPVLAGLVACLWQLHPDRPAQQIMDAVRRSASFFDHPNDSLGYGVPDFGAASAWLTLTTVVNETPLEAAMQLFPSPFVDRLHVVDPRLVQGTVHVVLFDTQGRAMVFTRTVVDGTGGLLLTDDRLAGLKPGAYIVVVEQDGRTFQQRVIKAR